MTTIQQKERLYPSHPIRRFLLTHAYNFHNPSQSGNQHPTRREKSSRVTKTTFARLKTELGTADAANETQDEHGLAQINHCHGSQHTTFFRSRLSLNVPILYKQMFHSATKTHNEDSNLLDADAISQRPQRPAKGRTHGSLTTF
jgi:acetoin utilization deacetylase AcuC-like enzyme